MTDAQLAIILQNVPMIISAVFAGFASYMVLRVKAKLDNAAAVLARKSDENTAITEKTAQKTDDLVHKSDEIAGKVDGHLSKLTEELAAANARIKEGNDQIKEGNDRQKTMQDLVNQLIQATLTNGKSAHAAPISVTPQRGDEATVSLKQIDENTAAIEKNTARTVADVQDLKGKS